MFRPGRKIIHKTTTKISPNEQKWKVKRTYRDNEFLVAFNFWDWAWFPFRIQKGSEIRIKASKSIWYEFSLLSLQLKIAMTSWWPFKVKLGRKFIVENLESMEIFLLISMGKSNQINIAKRFIIYWLMRETWGTPNL